ncbi:acetyltransferase [Malikia spinosa]|uniref:acetyltransferase n=1 Tax=Malikia spinosa TaxID=86180 RepID=UPI002FD88631
MTGRTILVGAGGFGRELLCWALDAHRAGNFPKISGFLDANPSALDGFNYGISWIGSIDDFSPAPNDQLLLGIGDPVTKRNIATLLLGRGGNFITLRHPTAVVASSATLGQGVVLCPYSVVSADVEIGDFVTINVNSTIGHDSSIGSFTTFSAHVDVTGGVQVGEGTFFGTSAAIVPRVKIGHGAKIGAGALIMRSVAPDSVMYVMPAKKF